VGIRAHPMLTAEKTSKGHHGTPSLGCVGPTVRPSLHSISQNLGGKGTDIEFSSLFFLRAAIFLFFMVVSPYSWSLARP